MIESDDLIIATFVQKHWEIGQEDYQKLIKMKDNHGCYLCILGDGIPKRLLGHPVEIVGSKGIRLIFTFSDGTKHKIDIE